MPENANLSPRMRLWIGEMIARFGAAARGASHLYPAHAEPWNALVAALEQHYESWADETEKAERLHPGVPVAVSAETPRPARLLMRDMDILLARMAHRPRDGDAVHAELLAILQRAVELVAQGRAAPP